MKSFRVAILLLALLAIGCGKLPLVGKIVDEDTLPERLSDAEIVVFGKLLSLNERAIIEEETGFNYKRYNYYDLGKIEVVEVLKGDYEKNAIFISLLSFDQTQPDQLKIECRHFSYHDIWKPGIWLIDIVKGREPQFHVRLGNYVPSHRLDEVKDLIENK